MTGPGGKREGAGRKAMPESERRRMYSVRLSPEVINYLRSRPNATAAIEEAIMRSKAFREWRNAS